MGAVWPGIASLAAACVLAGCAPRGAVEVAGVEAGRTDWPSAIEVAAQACANCHFSEPPAAPLIPTIAGRSEVVLAAQLLAFKLDQTPGATVMPRLAKGFTDAELEQLARYFAHQQTPGGGR